MQKQEEMATHPISALYGLQKIGKADLFFFYHPYGLIFFFKNLSILASLYV